jgi:hypothetical protein
MSNVRSQEAAAVPAHRIQFTKGGEAQWAGMADLSLVSPDGRFIVELHYEGEPPHGDSYHSASFGGNALPGLFWGCMFAFSGSSRYFVGSWMQRKFERHTAVVNLEAKQYFVLPSYIYNFKVSWPAIIGVGESSHGRAYSFRGSEKWLAC